jgi:hypothetical protein
MAPSTGRRLRFSRETRREKFEVYCAVGRDAERRSHFASAAERRSRSASARVRPQPQRLRKICLARY